MQNNRYKKISKQEFEDFLFSVSVFVEFPAKFYQFDWIENKNNGWEKIDTVIKEFCYVLPLDSGLNTCLKIYSSVDKETRFTRDMGTDAIRIVVADSNSGKPIRPRFTKVYRTELWRKNLRLRIANALESMGEKMICPLCKNTLVPRKRGNDNARFLGCSQFPKCQFTKSISI